jgi:hypothetical protein
MKYLESSDGVETTVLKRTGRNLARRTALGLVSLSALSVPLLLAPGCGSGFVACEENRTCQPSPNGGNAGAETGLAGDGATEGGTTTAGGADNGAAEGGAAPTNSGGEPGSPGGAEGTAQPVGSGGDSLGDGGAPIGGMGAAGTGGTGPLPDTTAPTIVSVTPTNNSKGVANNATIVITWSEPMNKASAQASFQCPDLAGKVTFDWPSATAMTVTPSEPLVYAQGKHADLATLQAKSYAITLNTSAQDLAGNALAKTYTSKFSTLRRVTWSVSALTNANIYVLTSAGTVGLGDSDSGVHVGDQADNSWQRMAVQFDLSGIPAAATGVVYATFSMPMTMTASWTGKPLGLPFANLGKVVLDHIQTPKIDSSALLLEPLRRVGDLATAATPAVKTLEATTAIADDLAKRAQRKNHSQFRAQFTTTTNGDSSADAVFFGYNADATLSVDYLIP